MSTTHFVQCPHHGCDWFGPLAGGLDAESWNEQTPAVSILVFSCPNCRHQWRARVIGLDVEALPPDDSGADLEAVAWPPLDLGVGD